MADFVYTEPVNVVRNLGTFPQCEANGRVFVPDRIRLETEVLIFLSLYWGTGNSHLLKESLSFVHLENSE